MIRHREQLFAAVLALALLVLGPVTQAVAQESAGENDQEVTLIGQLDRNDEGGYVLIDQESGSKVALQGPKELADHVGTKVKVTGKWSKDEKGMRIFQASKVEKAE